MTLTLDTRTMALHAPGEGGYYVELGGGDQPVIRPNLDVRPGPTVDIVHDLEKPLPFKPAAVDGFFSRYMLEHVSWRRLPALLAEIVTALKPGGSLVAVVPDTEAQMRHLLRTEDWSDGGSMLFGGQDYPENSHKAFLCSHLLQKWLTEAGCDKVLITAHGEKGTDMIVQARKSEVYAPAVPQILREGPRMKIRVGPGIDMRFPESWQVSPKPDGQGLKTDSPAVTFFVDGGVYWAEGPQDDKFSEGADGFWTLKGADPEPALEPPYDPEGTFDRAYFDGGNKGGGYGLYRDFPHHHLSCQRVLALRPTSIVEIGCGRGYLLRRLYAEGVPTVYGIDVSDHCYLTSVLAHEQFLISRAQDVAPWSRIMDKADLCLSVDVLDCFPESELPRLFANVSRWTRRGLHAIRLNPAKSDKTRPTVRPLSWWRERLPEGHEAIDLTELEGGPLPASYVEGDGKVKLNLGSHAMMLHRGWENIDEVDLSQFAQSEHYKFRRLDLTQGLPHATDSVDMVAASHVLEHLTRADGLELLRNCRRVMKSGAPIRILVPDAGQLMSDYIAGTLDYLNQLSSTVEKAPTQIDKLYAVLQENHKAQYDEAALCGMLAEAGFVSVEACEYGCPPPDATDAELQLWREAPDCLPCVSLIVSARVP